MSAAPITPTSVVDDILRSLPEARSLFLAFHTHCIGCPLGRFCTLEEVTQHYHLDLTTMVAGLRSQVGWVKQIE